MVCDDKNCLAPNAFKFRTAPLSDVTNDLSNIHSISDNENKNILLDAIEVIGSPMVETVNSSLLCEQNGKIH